MQITVRPLSGPSEFAMAEDVQISAWELGSMERSVTPKDIMVAINDNGGLVLGAFEGKRMVGFALLVPGYNGKRVYMYSHQTGVVKEYQSKGVGYLLKAGQRKISLERGFDLIAWTFDPLIARNAYFNFRKLGTIARTYLVDYYGPMDAPANRGWPTDRFLCEWLIKPAVLRRVRSFADLDVKGAHAVIKKTGDEPYPVCRDWSVDLTVRMAFVDIPRDIVQLKSKYPGNAGRWRDATRDIFRRYFGAGFAAVTLLERDGSFGYLLTKARLPKSELAEHYHPS